MLLFIAVGILVTSCLCVFKKKMLLAVGSAAEQLAMNPEVQYI